MKTKAVAFLSLGIVLAAALVLQAGCGSTAATALDKAKLSAALSGFELSAGAVTQALAAGSDSSVAADIKAAKADMKAKWDAVLAVTETAGWSEQEAAREAWNNVEHAIDSLADNATVTTANQVLTPSMDALMVFDAELWNLVQTTE